ncbi:MAG: hypothetical protein WBA74_00790 [Cyclobacteriaceae bacterium]
MIDNNIINGILTNIKTKVPVLDWDFIVKYHNGEDVAITELRLFRRSSTKYLGKLTFDSNSGRIIRGTYRKNLLFSNDTDLTDALLEVLSYELDKAA